MVWKTIGKIKRVATVQVRHYRLAMVPALTTKAAEFDSFSAKLDPELDALKARRAPGEIIRNSPDALTIPLPIAAIDVDTEFDLRQLAPNWD